MDFFIIANAWSAGNDNPTSKHRIAFELVRQGHRVLWIEGSGMRTPSVGSSHDRLRMVRKVAAALRGVRREEPLSGCSAAALLREYPKAPSSSPPTPQQPNHLTTVLHVLSPLFIPLPRYELIRRLNGLICRVSMRFWGWRLGFRDPVLINYVPVLAEAMCGWRHESRAPRVVYHCVDRWDAFAMYDSAMMGEMDRRCCEIADVVIASSQELVERCRRYSTNVYLISHGVDHDHFARALQVMRRPEDLPPGHVVGFFGLLSEWLDQDLLLEIARQVPDCEVVLIGKEDVPIERLRNIRNIHLLGSRPFHRLPEYVAHFDVGLIPFVVNELTKAVNPIKLREMLSAGCPVVSTALPEVQVYQGEGVVIADTVDQFIEAVVGRVRKPITVEARAAISASVANETWSAKVGEILTIVDGKPQGSPYPNPLAVGGE